MEASPGKNKSLWRWLLVLLLALLAAAIWYALFYVNRFSLELLLSGQEKMTLEYGERYVEPGVTAVFRGTLFLREGRVPEGIHIHTETDMNESSLGHYHVRYFADYHGFHGEARRDVRVVDTQPPVITLNEDPEGSPEPGAEYREAGYSAWDNYDGDITDRVVRVEEPGLVTYAVTDSSGNPAVAKRRIPVPIVPEIHLEGGDTCTITLGSRYVEPGFSATDPVDGDLTQQVMVEGEVDWLSLGTYPITYTVTNSHENTTVVKRSVEVVAQLRPDTCYPEGKTVYLTFDDGPSAYTAQLLDVLDRYDAKATFFVVGTGSGKLMEQIVERGHSIGIHSVSHDYDAIYASPEAFFTDLMQTQEIIYRNTGVKTTLMRFPGGSSNMVSRKSCPGIMTYLTEAVQDAGFQFFDWNVYSGDAGETRKTSQVVDNVIAGICQQPVSIVLQHDIHDYSVAAVEEILRWGQENGYQFLPLSPNSPGFHHDLNN